MIVLVSLNIVLTNGLFPRSPTVRLGVIDVDTSPDDVDVYALTAVLLELVLGEGGEDEFGLVADTSETLRGKKKHVSYVGAGRTTIV